MMAQRLARFFRSLLQALDDTAANAFAAKLTEDGNIHHADLGFAVVDHHPAYRLAIEENDQVFGMWKHCAVTLGLQFELLAQQFFDFFRGPTEEREFFFPRADENAIKKKPIVEGHRPGGD
jgi:hypothetical protein